MLQSISLSAGRQPMKYYSFEILIEKEAEDEGYYAYSPTMPVRIIGDTNNRGQTSILLLP
jgi:hypothetical protein